MDAVTLLKEKGIRPSLIRIMVLEYLMAHKTHPTVEEVYDALIKNVPTLSKTSVYNTLHLLAENEIILEITIDPTKVRYDADTSLHGHFHCHGCHQIADFSLDESLVAQLMPSGYTAEGKSIYFSGRCPQCSETKS